MKPLIVTKTQALIYVSPWTDYRKRPGHSVQQAKKLIRIIWNIQEIQVLRITCEQTKIIIVFQWPLDRVVYWCGQYLAGGEAQCTDILILCQMPWSTNILHTINWWILNMAKDSMSTYRYLNCSNSLLPDNLLLLKLSMKLCWKF